MDIGLSAKEVLTINRAVSVIQILDNMISTTVSTNTTYQQFSSSNIDSLSECLYGTDEIPAKVLIATSLCGVAFTQGNSNSCIFIFILLYYNICYIYCINRSE